ncbi:MAG: hypothetical protein VCA17_00885 [Dehalococcoidia bacterium]|jgi:photosystem II stability/assembly factor-like uncharacterized protein
MATTNDTIHVYVGLAGEGDNIAEGGLLRRAVDSDKWESIADGLPEGPQVRALLVHPDDPATVYAGTQLGVYRSRDRGASWKALHCPDEGTNVWSLAFNPSNPDIIFAGYEPCAIYRSSDAGSSWQKMDTSRIAYPNVTTYMPPLAKRVIGIAADPSDPSDVYAAVEVGGLLASRDGGDSWDSITDGLYTDNHTVDLHGVKLSAAAPGNVFIIAQVAMFRSPDRGRRWQHLRFGEMFPGGSYCRGLAIAPDDPKTVYLAAGAGGGGAPAGTEEAGALFRSRDLGDTWERLDIGDTPPSRMFQVAIPSESPNQVYCVSKDGHFFSSDDGGDSWASSRLPVETTRSLHVYPMACG